MPLRSWGEGIGTGVLSLDAEHRLQVGAVNSFEELVRRDDDHGLAERTLLQLVEFTSIHFEAEELMMRLYAFPGVQAHAAAHAQLLARAAEMRRHFDAGERLAALQLVGELRDWLLAHIETLDQAFATWLVENGASAQHVDADSRVP